MLDYIKRGIQTGEQRNAEVLIIQLNTPGGDLLTTLDIIAAMRASKVPVVMYVAPKNAIAGSAWVFTSCIERRFLRRMNSLSLSA